MKIWYEITPLDTLFLRGSEPMEAGQVASAPLFPPPVSVIQGALRTAVLKERGISFSDYKAGKAPDEIVGLIGECGKEPPFSVTAIALKTGKTIYAQAPVTWHVDVKEKPKGGKDYNGLKVIVSGTTPSDTSRLGIISSSGYVPLVRAEHEAVSLAGCWVNMELLNRPAVVFGEKDVLAAHEVFSVENRIGIAIDSRRKVEEGKLYSAHHIRLHDGVTILVAVDRDMGLAGEGILQLGGEQRKSRYAKLSQEPSIPSVSSPAGYVALAPVAVSREILTKIVYAGRPVSTAGWDLSKGFHKPSSTWLPAGTVFSDSINASCVTIAQ